jgi:hypothetical protein
MPKYPIEPLSRVRLKKVDDATRTLADAIHTRLDAAVKAEQATAARREHEAKAEVLRAAERGALEQGALTASDLARADAWAARAAAEQAALVRGEADARATETKAKGEESTARDGVAARKADVNVIDKHHERWRDALAKARDAKEEEENGEAWRPKGPA